MTHTQRSTPRRPVAMTAALILLLAAGGCGTLPTQPDLDPQASGAAPAAATATGEGGGEMELLDSPGGGGSGSDGSLVTGDPPATQVGQPPFKWGKKPKKHPR